MDGSEESWQNCTSNDGNDVPLHCTMITSCYLFQLGNSFFELMISNQHPDENETVVNLGTTHNGNAPFQIVVEKESVEVMKNLWFQKISSI